MDPKAVLDVIVDYHRLVDWLLLECRRCGSPMPGSHDELASIRARAEELLGIDPQHVMIARALVQD